MMFHTRRDQVMILFIKNLFNRKSNQEWYSAKELEAHTEMINNKSFDMMESRYLGR